MTKQEALELAEKWLALGADEIALALIEQAMEASDD